MSCSPIPSLIFFRAGPLDQRATGVIDSNLQ
jgi:hypothetical protein